MPIHQNPRANILQKNLVELFQSRVKGTRCQDTPSAVTQVNEPCVSYDLHHIIQAASLYAGWMCSSNEENNKMQQKR